jgi:hypothetical protein
VVVTVVVVVEAVGPLPSLCSLRFPPDLHSAPYSIDSACLLLGAELCSVMLPPT